MNLERVDLNLLTHLDVLLREKNVTRAAEQLGVTQPAMSNILRRLRVLFNAANHFRNRIQDKGQDKQH